MAQLSVASKEQATTSDEIVMATNEMSELVQQVTTAMGEQSQAVDVVSQSSEEMRQRVEQVAEAMKEQSQTADHVASSMGQVSQVAEQALQSSQEMNRSTTDIAGQAADLKTLANSFEEEGEGAQTSLQALSRRRQLLEQLAQKGDLELDELLKWATEGVVDYFDAFFSRVWVVEKHPQSGEEMLHMKASSGAYNRIRGSSREWAPLAEDYKLGVIVRRQRPIISDQVQEDPQVKDQTWARRERLRSFAGYPLQLENGCAGVLIAYSRNEITSEEHSIFAAFVEALSKRLASFHLKTV